MTAYIYILASSENGTLYTGVTTNLPKRIYEHKSAITKGFVHKYKVYNLVYYEEYDDIKCAIEREKKLKKWKRAWKLNLINDFNPDWKDFYEDIICW
jgi:putative endonuclease